MSAAASDITKGFTAEFIEREMELLRAIIDGKAIEHHLEPSYYKSLSYVTEKFKEMRENEGKEKEMRENEMIEKKVKNMEEKEQLI